MVLWYNPYLSDCLCFASDATPYIPTPKLGEVQSLFVARLDVFDPITGLPNDADLTWLHKDLTAILFPLPYNVEKGIQNLTVLVMDEDDYKQRYCAKLPTPTNPNFYNESTPNNATDVVYSKDEAVHMSTIADYLLFSATELETHDFILGVVEDTRFRKLREPVTFYTAMVPP